MDDLVDVVVSEDQTDNDMVSVAVSLEKEFCSSGEDVDLEFVISLDEFFHRKDLWFAIN